MASVAIVGASAKPDRPSHHAVEKYLAAGWTVWPVHPSAIPVAGQPTFPDLTALPGPVDIVSLYVNPRLGMELVPLLEELQPRLVWLNPGADSPELADALHEAGLEAVIGCNLVALTLNDERLRVP